jgi:hypothetical protein
MENKGLTGSDIRLLEKISGNFPGGVIPIETVNYWLNCQNITITERLNQSFKEMSKKIVINDKYINVDRSALPTYPFGSYRIQDKALELVGPTKYNIDNVKKEFLGDKTDSSMLYFKAQREDKLAIQLCFADLLAIKEKGVDFYLHYFGNEKVFALRSILWSIFSTTHLPFLHIKDMESVEVGVCSFNTKWDPGWSALYFDFEKNK